MTIGQYSAGVVASMTLIFGEGFLSPGGPEEVRRIFDSQGIDTPLAGRSVIDWGSGLGGTSMALVEQCGAESVMGIDIEPGNVEKAEDLVSRKGLSDKITFRLVEPGPMPMEEGVADLIFTKEALCHIDEKEAVFADYKRILKPGGLFVGSDWMTGHENPQSDAYRAWDNQLRDAGLHFDFQSIARHEAGLEAVGFEAVEIVDDSDWTIAHGTGYVERLEGEERPRMLALLGDEGLAGLIMRCKARVEALKNGDLRRCHMRAVKPL